MPEELGTTSAQNSSGKVNKTRPHQPVKFLHETRYKTRANKIIFVWRSDIATQLNGD